MARSQAAAGKRAGVCPWNVDADSRTPRRARRRDQLVIDRLAGAGRPQAWVTGHGGSAGDIGHGVTGLAPAAKQQFNRDSSGAPGEALELGRRFGLECLAALRASSVL